MEDAISPSASNHPSPTCKIDLWFTVAQCLIASKPDMWNFICPVSHLCEQVKVCSAKLAFFTSNGGTVVWAWT
jgi:hypothetical protein